MRIFLAGATGVIGRRLVPLLVGKGHEVIGTSRDAAKATGLMATGAHPVILDMLDRDAVFAALREARPDVVIDQLTDLGNRNFSANSRLRIAGTRHLVDAALSAGVKRMVVQSIAFAYAPGVGPATEAEPLDVDSSISQRRETVRAVAELEAAVAEVETGVILRYGLLYGRGTWYARGGFFAGQVRSGAVAATADISSFLHVADAAQAAVEALQWPAGPVNLVDDEPAPASEWLPAFAAVIGAPPPPASDARQPFNRGASNAKARQRLGWVPRYPTWRTGFVQGL